MDPLLTQHLPARRKPQPFDDADTRPFVLFVGRAGGRLMDNVKYVFLEAATRDYGFAPCFLTTHRDECDLLRGAGLPVHMVGHCGREWLSKARLAVLDDFTDKCGTHLQAALTTLPKLQLWHGIPLKKIGFPEIESQVNMTDEKRMHLAVRYSGFDCVASTSDYVTEELFSRVFRAKDMRPYGLPRNDALLRAPEAYDLLNSDRDLYALLRKHKKAGGKVAVYMPTFRDTGGDFLRDESLDLQLVASFCQRHNILLVAKFHPYVQAESFHGLPGFVLCNSATDMYPLLPLGDVLITDYSSIYFDWLLLDKPVLFFAYDKEKYQSCDREFFFRYEEVTPGFVSTNQDQFLGHLAQTLLAGDDPFAPARRALAQKLFAHQDAFSSARWCLYMRDYLGLSS